MIKLTQLALASVGLAALLLCLSSCDPKGTSGPSAGATPLVTPDPTPTPYPSRMNLQEAIDQNVVTASAHGIDVEKMSVSVHCSHAMTIIIPVGTLFESGGGDTQNMIAASTSAITCFDSTTPQIKTVSLEVYCINRLKDAPTKTSEFQVSSMEETDPIRKLDACLEHQNAEHHVRQLAIWMVSENYLDSTQEEVKQKLQQHMQDDVQKELDQNKTKLLKEFREQFPQFNDLSDQDILSVIQRKNSEEAAKYAAQEVALYHDKAGPLLVGCGIDTSTKKFFTSAPNSQ